jgi:hypothetical protein
LEVEIGLNQAISLCGYLICGRINDKNSKTEEKPMKVKVLIFSLEILTIILSDFNKKITFRFKSSSTVHFQPSTMKLLLPFVLLFSLSCAENFFIVTIIHSFGHDTRTVCAGSFFQGTQRIIAPANCFMLEPQNLLRVRMIAPPGSVVSSVTHSGIIPILHPNFNRQNPENYNVAQGMVRK